MNRTIDELFIFDIPGMARKTSRIYENVCMEGKSDERRGFQRKMDSTYTIIQFFDTPSEGNWQFLALEKKDSHGRTMRWSIGYTESSSEFIIVHSNRSEPMIVPVIPKSTRTHLQQAVQDARTRYTSKIRGGYLSENAIEGPLFTPQLAMRYKGEGIATANFAAGLAVQPKADGVRSIPYIKEGKVILRSRKNVAFPAPLDEMKKQIAVLMQYLPPACHLDGELYVHGLPLQDLRSIVTNRVDVEGFEKVCFCVFDLAVTDRILEERINILLDAYQRMIEDEHPHDKILLMQTAYVADKEGLDRLYQHFLELGFEGVVMRQLAGPNCAFRERSLYTGSRNKNLYKYKPEWEDEGIVIEVFPAEKERGAAMFRLELENGITFNIRPAGKVTTRIEWMRTPEKFLGRIYTFKYQGYTNAGIPIFGVGKAFRDHAY